MGRAPTWLLPGLFAAALPLWPGTAGAPAPAPAPWRAPAPAPAPAPSLRLSEVGWLEQARAQADVDTLERSFEASAYAPPEGTLLLAARVDEGAQQPSFRYYSLGNTGFLHSEGRFWPASTVKLAAAVGALQTLAGHGLTADAVVRFDHPQEGYDGTVRDLLEQALVPSSNSAYNHLLVLAGFDELNEGMLTEAAGFPTLTIQRRFQEIGDRAHARWSPPIRFSEGGREGVIAARRGVSRHPTCPNDGNCGTLFELLDLMRRVTLHAELPPRDRFRLHPRDAAELVGMLGVGRSRMWPGAEEALGAGTRVFNKTGTVRDDDRLDHGLVVHAPSGRRFLLALSVPWEGSDEDTASELARRTLLAILADDDPPAPVQRDAGALRIGLRAGHLVLDAEGPVSFETWLDGRRVAPDAAVAPGQLLGVRARRGDTVVAHRAGLVEL